LAAANGTALSGGSVTVTGSAGGTLTVYANGSFYYMPPATGSFIDTYTFTVTDGIGSTTAQLQVTAGGISIIGGPPL
jgi:hypothetical protein